MQSTSAVVVACRTADPRFASVAPYGLKSLIPIDGRPAISYLAEHLRACDLIDRVIIVGDEVALGALPDANAYVPATSADASSLMAGIEAAADSERCLLMSGDMPLAAPEALTDFLANAPNADVIYPIASEVDVQQVFPHRKTGYVRTKEGRFTGSSCLLLRTQAAVSKKSMVGELLQARENPTALLGLIGAGFGLKMMLSTPSLREFERHLTKVLGLECRVYVTRYPMLLFSFDSPEDLRIANEGFNRGSGKR